MHESTPLDRRFLLGGLAGAAGVAAFSRVAAAGPLAPPSGAVSPSGKTTQELFDRIGAASAQGRIEINATNTPGNSTALFRITQPGSYYLSGGITGVSGKHGIRIECNDVTIELNGWIVQGIAGSLNGVSTPTNTTYTGITLRNGAVRGWGSNGVELIAYTSQTACLLERISAEGNGGTGIRTGAAVINNCQAGFNGGDGFFCLTDGSVLNGCAAFENTLTGFSVVGGTVLACSATRNGSHGFEFFGGTVVTGCHAGVNAGAGFETFTGGCNFNGCDAAYNGLSGFEMMRSRAADCSATGNTLWGFDVAQMGVLERSQAWDNRTGGILGRDAFSIGGGAIMDCNVSNEGRAIPGIRITGKRFRVERNHTVNCSIGVEVTGTSNLIISNSISGTSTTPMSVGLGNSVGPLATATAVNTVTVITANFVF